MSSSERTGALCRSGGEEFISSRGNLGRLPDKGGLDQDLLGAVAFTLGEEEQCAVRDQQGPVLKHP